MLKWPLSPECHFLCAESKLEVHLTGLGKFSLSIISMCSLTAVNPPGLQATWPCDWRALSEPHLSIAPRGPEAGLRYLCPSLPQLTPPARLHAAAPSPCLILGMPRQLGSEVGESPPTVFHSQSRILLKHSVICPTWFSQCLKMYSTFVYHLK